MNGTHTPRAEMSEIQRQAARRQSKHWKYLRQAGRPAMVGQAEVQRARQRVQLYRSMGMSLDAMERAGGGRSSNLSYLIGSPRKQLRRTTYDAIMAMRFVEPEGRSSSRVPALGVQRRLQALWADGYPSDWLADQLGKSRSNLMHLMQKPGAFTTFPTHWRVAELYSKLAGTKPEDNGHTYWAAQTARSWSRRKGFVPSLCWDEDTIDDPMQWPEWTGRCGTVRGYNIHVDEKVTAGHRRMQVHAIDYAGLAVFASPALNRRSRQRQHVWPSARKRFIGACAGGDRAFEQKIEHACANCSNAQAIYRRFPHLAEVMGIVELDARGTGRQKEWDY